MCVIFFAWKEWSTIFSFIKFNRYSSKSLHCHISFLDHSEKKFVVHFPRQKKLTIVTFMNEILTIYNQIRKKTPLILNVKVRNSSNIMMKLKFINICSKYTADWIEEFCMASSHPLENIPQINANIANSSHRHRHCNQQ